MSKIHTIEVYDSSDNHYKCYDTDDLEIDGHTLEERDKHIRADVIDECIKFLKESHYKYEKADYIQAIEDLEHLNQDY